MIDHQAARIWADNHDSLARTVTDLVAQAKEAFAVLAAIHYDAPWRRDAAR